MIKSERQAISAVITVSCSRILIKLSLEGFEPPTFGSVDRRSIQLGYRLLIRGRQYSYHRNGLQGKITLKIHAVRSGR